jgi:hypothetical protein
MKSIVPIVVLALLNASAYAVPVTAPKSTFDPDTDVAAPAGNEGWIKRSKFDPDTHVAAPAGREEWVKRK